MRSKAALGILAMSLMVGSASAAITFNNSTQIAPGDTSYDGQDLIVDNCTLTVDGPHTFNSLQLINNAQLTHTAAPTGEALNRLDLTILGSLSISADSEVEVTGRGYADIPDLGNGPGGGTGTRSDYGGGGGGGAYGGNGGDPNSPYAGGTAYGSVKEPNQAGSAGGVGYAGNGGAGGGVIRLRVNGTLQLDGAIVANGHPGVSHSYGASGGGAGGSVWITAGSLTGAGTITANGGAGHIVNEEDSGGGAGGRIAVYAAGSTFSGTMTAYGATGHVGGGPGSVFTKVGGQAEGSLLVDAGGVLGGFHPWIATNAFDTLVVTNAAHVQLLGGQNLQVNQRLEVATDGTMLCLGANRAGMVEGRWEGIGPTITAGEVVVQPGGAITASGFGYTGTTGTGNGPGGGSGTRSDYDGGGGGGAHGGNGGNPQGPHKGGLAYGDLARPTNLGSAGGAGYSGDGAAGGGAIRFVVAGELAVLGSINANGANGSSHWLGANGAGAGGSIWITAGTLSGDGAITANGGIGNIVSEEDGGGGAGGRIAVETDANFFSGLMTARGADGHVAGGAGTILLRSSSQPAGTVILDNGSLVTGTHPWIETNAVDVLLITNSARLQLVGGQTLQVNGALTIGTNSIIVCVGSNRSAQVNGQWRGVGPTISAGALNVAPGGAITASGLGYTGTAETGNGPGGGTGTRSDTPGGGGGGAYGGNGGNPQSPYLGGSAYGDFSMPTDLGSAGGAGYPADGAAGGGAIRLIVTGDCVVDGRVEANGIDGSSHNYGANGGGAGGSIWIAAGALSGTGLITANGGIGRIVSEEDGGGGAGGRIAIYTDTDTFSGTLAVLGGSGHVPGGAGTIFTKSSSQDFGTLTISTGTTNNAATPWLPSQRLDRVVIPAGSRLGLGGSATWSVGEMTLDPGATLTLQGDAILKASECRVSDGAVIRFESTNHTVQVNGEWIGRSATLCADSLTLEGGSWITADGLGYTATPTSGNGPGGGTGTRYDTDGGGGGAGHGGRGGEPTSSYDGGDAYGSVKQPAALGSAGGAGYAGVGGAGGGAIRVIVTNTFTLDGMMSANGLNGASHRWGSSGGGAGGSVWIATGFLTGTGAVSAVGGSTTIESEEDGGGGAGGRIALWCGMNEFTGSLSAFGGTAQNSGAAGTIFTKTSAQTDGTLWLDNHGIDGAETPWPTAGVFDHVIITNAARLRTPAYGFVESGTVEVEDNGWLWLSGNSLQFFDHLLVRSNGMVACDSLYAGGMVNEEWRGAGPTISARAVTVDGYGQISADGLGYRATSGKGNGPGGGSGTRSDGNGGGGGGGYGGPGASGEVNQPGGIAYGSEFEPTDLGSAGGAGYAGIGGNGGGAIRLIASESVTVNGRISANGSPGLHHNWGASGGGAGGSVWISTPVLEGLGLILANGGNGFAVSEEDSGGGGGGRVAVYGTTTAFNGSILASAGGGSRPGGLGTVYLSDAWPAPHVLAQWPSGERLHPVQAVEIHFDQALDDATVSAEDVVVTTPNGTLAPGEFDVALLGGVTLRATFAAQTAAGNYTIQIGPQIQNRSGQSMSAFYTGQFSIVHPVISGVVTNAAGEPVADCVMQAGPGVFTVTDATGSYALVVLPGWSGTVTPVGADWIFAPSQRSYTNLTAHVAGQFFIGTRLVGPTIVPSTQPGSIRLEWQSTAGMTYQVQTSETLTDWTDHGVQVNGDGSVLFIEFDMTSAEKQFYRIRMRP